jgi:hypothetical protein
MSKFRFSAKDFEIDVHHKSLTPFAAAVKANAKLDAHLKTLTKAYSSLPFPGLPCKTWSTSLECFKDDRHSDLNWATHTALLFDMEELKPRECSHEPDHQRVAVTGLYLCRKCGAKLKAKWKVVE